MRDKLLAHLPQPENLAAYREETASLLAKHERETFWTYWNAQILSFCAMVVLFMAMSDWAQKLGHHGNLTLCILAGLMFFSGMGMSLNYSINRSKVQLLKEVKQVQLQILGLQASLQKDGKQ
jgi:hypothetical protein